MANVDIRLGYKNAAWFTTNAALVLEEGQVVNLEQTGTYKLGDGITALSALSFLGSSNLGFTPEDVANKQTDLTPSATKYPTVNAVNAGLALKANINPRVSTIASSTTPSINIDSYDRLVTTALSGNITTTTVTGTPAHGRCIIFETTDNGLARSINRGASFVAGMASLPITTLIGKTLYEAYEYDSGISKWRCFATGINL